MKLNTRMVGAASAMVLAGGLGFVSLPNAEAAAPPKVDVSNHTVTCDTFYGSIKSVPALTLAGSGPGTITVKGVLDGCHDDTVGDYDATSNPGGVSLAPAKVKGTLNVTSTSCTALAGLSAGTSGSLTTTWKTVAGTPKLLANSTTLNVNQTNGAFSTVQTASNNFSASYGEFQIGTPASYGGTLAPSATGNFAGTDGGASSTVDVVTSQSVGALLAACSTPAGLKAINLGLGIVHIG